jgi:hypothetical protein
MCDVEVVLVRLPAVASAPLLCIFIQAWLLAVTSLGTFQQAVLFWKSGIIVYKCTFTF